MRTRALHVLGYLALLCLGLSGGVIAAEPRAIPAVDGRILQAITSMASDTDHAEAVLRADSDAESRLALVILLHVFRPETPERNSEIRSLLSALPQFSYSGRRYPESEYEGTTESLKEFILRAVSGGVHTHKERGGWNYYLIPCSVLERDPALIDILGVWLAKVVPVPRSDCPIGDWRLPQSFYDYVKTTHALIGGSNDPVLHEIILDDGFQLRAHMFPLQLLPPGAREELAAGRFFPDAAPFKTWGMLSLWNWDRYLVIQSKYSAARDDLTDHYMKRFDLDRRMAREVAARVLWASAKEHNSPAFASDDLRHLILSGAPVTEIAKRLPAAWPRMRSESDVFNALWGVADPLEAIALRHLDALRFLLSRGGDPNVRALPFGKTPLMMAAQLDLPQAVTILLNAGANPNIATDRNALRQQGEAWRQVSLGGYYSAESFYAVPDLQHDQRTALMYAAANASLPVIQLLLRAGADKAARDSRGLTAVEYLTGNGPVPANPRISEQARAEALRLLSP